MSAESRPRPELPAPASALPGLARPDWGGLLLLLVAVVGWGSNWAPLKLVLREVPPLTVRTIGGLGGAAMLALIVGASGQSLRVPRGVWPRLTFLALLNITAWMGLVAVALLWLDASEAVVITYTVPVWSALIAWPVLGERPTPLKLLALACGLGGVALVMLGKGVDIGLAKLPGVALCLAASVCFALGTVLTKRRPLAMPQGAGVVWQLILGNLPMAAGALLLERPDLGAVSTGAWLWMAYMAVLPLCFSYLAWFAALRRLPATVAIQGSLIAPMVGIAGSALLLSEPFGLRQALAFGLMLLAIRG
jgi:drug/metabolite transporter (DMT)-like permease